MKHFKLEYLIIILLLLLCIAEGIFIFVQHQANKASQAKSQERIKSFLANNKQIKASSLNGVYTKLQNIEFYWNKEIFVYTPQLMAKVMPLKGNTVNFDNINSFKINIYEGKVYIQPKAFESILKQQIFDQKGSNLHNLKLGLAGQKLKLTGNLDFVLSIPFEMTTHLNIDQKNNTLVVCVDDLKAFGFIPAKKLIGFQTFNLDKLVKIPQNKHLMIKRNQIFIKPFGLFPPPRIMGKMQNIKINNSLFELSFASSNSPKFYGIPFSKSPNYVYLDGGNAQFNRLKMFDTQIQLIDSNPKNYFKIYLPNYFSKLAASKIQMQNNGAIVVYMPDNI